MSGNPKHHVLWLFIVVCFVIKVPCLSFLVELDFEAYLCQLIRRRAAFLLQVEEAVHAIAIPLLCDVVVHMLTDEWHVFDLDQ